MTRLITALSSICLFASPAFSEGAAGSGGGSGADGRDAASQDPAIAAIDAFIDGQNVQTDSPGWKTGLEKPPVVEFNADKKYRWHLDTNLGPIVIELLPDVAPMHASSTIYLTRLTFYDGVPFHRVISGFMAQGGDPLGSGRGGPGYQYAGEFDPDAKHDRRGILSMANAGPNTDGSQFFITFGPTPHLDGKHTVFGRVVDGLETLDKLEAQGSGGGAPKQKLEITKATIRVE